MDFDTTFLETLTDSELEGLVLSIGCDSICHDEQMGDESERLGLTGFGTSYLDILIEGGLAGPCLLM